MTLDELRAAMPRLGFALYALDPGGAVTFEIVTPEGELYSFAAPTAQSAIDAAFPPLALAPLPPPNPANVFE